MAFGSFPTSAQSLPVAARREFSIANTIPAISKAQSSPRQPNRFRGKMASSRRFRVYGVLLLTIIAYIIYATGTSSRGQNPDFYDATKNAMKHPHDVSPGSNIRDGQKEDDALAIAMAARLKDAEKAAKEQANAKAPNREDHQEAIDKKAEKNKQAGVVGEKGPVDMTAPGTKKYPKPNEKIIPEKSEEDKDIEQELGNILKKSPIIIFSKSYCPFSAKAKHILLEKYSIVPAPFVVELDLHPTGALLQAKLAELTGRRTVPNILVTGKSIGGGDDIEAMDEADELVSKLQSMGGKRMSKVKKIS